MFISPDNENLQYMGRIDFDDPKAPVLVYACSTVKIIFKGTGIKAKLINHHHYSATKVGFLLDGKEGFISLPKTRGEEGEYIIAEGLSDEFHELLLIKRMDGCHYLTFLGFDITGSGELKKPEPLPDRRMEFIGDSVTAGEVIEAVDYVGNIDPEDHDGIYNNAYYSYAWQTARNLNAQIHDIAQGGLALLDGTGWFQHPDYVGLESVYDKIRYNGWLGETNKWDYKEYTPDVIVMAIGQNDANPVNIMEEDYEGAAAKNWRSRYEEFIRFLMKTYPKVNIILTTTVLMHSPEWDDAIDEVCKKINDERVTHFYYTRTGKATPGHPRIPEHDEMARELAAYINSLGEEIWK